MTAPIGNTEHVHQCMTLRTHPPTTGGVFLTGPDLLYRRHETLNQSLRLKEDRIKRGISLTDVCVSERASAYVRMCLDGDGGNFLPLKSTNCCVKSVHFKGSLLIKYVHKLHTIH